MRIRKTAGIVAIIATASIATQAAAAPPPNDDIADAITVTEGVEAPFSDVDATTEATEAFCAGEETVWFSFTAPADGDYVSYATGSNHDTDVAWSDALAGPLGTCNDDADDSYDAVADTRTMTEGEQEYVVVASHSDDEVGSGSIGVTAVVDGADDFGDATALTRREGTTTAVTGIAFPAVPTVETDEPTACGGSTLSDDSVWVDFTAPDAGTWMIEAKSTDEVDIAVFSGDSLDDLTLLNCEFDRRKAVLIGSTAGETYRIRIAGSAVTEPVVVRAERAPTPLVAELVDTDGDGTSTDVGTRSDLVYVDGEPAIAYYDDDNSDVRYASRSGGVWTDIAIDDSGTVSSPDLDIAVSPDGEPAIAIGDSVNGLLRYAYRSGGTWTIELVDDEGDGTSTLTGESPDLLFLSDGTPVIAYHDDDPDDLRFATRAGGSWSHILVDDDGGGGSDRVGDGAKIVEFDNGDLGIAYGDNTNSQVRYAMNSGAGWSDEVVYTHAAGGDVWIAGLVIDSTGAPWIAADIDDQGNHVVANHDGSSWNVEFTDANTGLAEQDYGCTWAELLINDQDELFLPWVDCNDSYYGGTSVRSADGTWSHHEWAATYLSPSDPAYAGYHSVGEVYGFGATWTPDGRLALSFQLEESADLWFAEGALVADIAGPAAAPAASAIALDGSGSADAWGSVVGYRWSDAPDGCSFSSTTAMAPTMWCVGPVSGTATLTVTDTDGLTHRVTHAVAVGNAECDTTPDPFTDVPATSYADVHVTCIYNLDVTTGTTATTYSPKDLLTREQMAALLARMYEAITGSPAAIVATPFTDVPDSSFAVDDIARLYGLGVTTGTSATTFSPDDTVTREQMAAFVARLFAAIRGEQAPIVATPFTDVPGSSFAASDIARIYGLGITTGTTATTYSPDDGVTREMMAAYLGRFYIAD
ncbi:MAG: hypothetical protein DHS20C19_17180 [Acidimicrobiales bacterium]|nr:MAG: hypothetical protein DHS20C19_17180 [Acidimicrobiales bacterium]